MHAHPRAVALEQLAHDHRQPADMVQMAVRDDDEIQFDVAQQRKVRQRAEPGRLRVQAAVHQDVQVADHQQKRIGADAALDFLESVEVGSFTLVALSSEDLARCRELILQYRGLSLGLADATVVVTAERLKVQRVFTVDQRHFRAIQPRGLGHFIILPADQE